MRDICKSPSPWRRWRPLVARARIVLERKKEASICRRYLPGAKVAYNYCRWQRLFLLYFDLFVRHCETFGRCVREIQLRGKPHRSVCIGPACYFRWGRRDNSTRWTQLLYKVRSFEEVKWTLRKTIIRRQSTRRYPDRMFGMSAQIAYDVR